MTSGLGPATQEKKEPRGRLGLRLERTTGGKVPRTLNAKREMGRFEGRVERLRAAAKERGELLFGLSTNSTGVGGERALEASEGSWDLNPDLGEPLLDPCS